jgi:uridine kinase
VGTDQVNKKIASFDHLCELLTLLPTKHSTLMVGIDAPGGSGKSIFTSALAKGLSQCTIVQMDDFFLPSRERVQGDPRKKPIGADFDWQRVISQVLEPLLFERDGNYQRYDWERDTLAEWHRVPTGGIVLVEGCYALHNELARFYDFTIWLECPRPIRLARGIARSGERIREIWENDWMIAEDLYREEQRPCERADLVVDSSGEVPHDREQEYVSIV